MVEFFSHVIQNQYTFYDVLKVLKLYGCLNALRLLLKTDNYEFLRYLVFLILEK